MAEDALCLTNLSKSFGATRALDSVCLRLASGEVHALLGENGAGKSTLIKIVSGVLRPDAGEVAVNGKPVDCRGPWDAVAAGISTVFQELTLVPDLSVAANLFLPSVPGNRLGYSSRRALLSRAEELLTTFGLSGMQPSVIASRLSLRDRQKVEIVRALARRPSVLLLDEPTSALGAADVDWLFGQIDAIKLEGTAVLYISHKLEEIRRIAERVTVQRNGRTVATYASADASPSRVVVDMIGRPLDLDAVGHARGRNAGTTALRVASLSVGDVLHDVTFEVRHGEVLGIAGLEGQGHRELFLGVAGFTRRTAGSILATREGGGAGKLPRSTKTDVALVPEDRKMEGLNLDLSIRHNVTIPALGKVAKLGWVRFGKERAVVEGLMDVLQVVGGGVDDTVSNLSGGNQQKVLLAKALITEAPILLLYDPTRGVDIGAKFEIYRFIREFVQAGNAVVLYSSEQSELVRLCDRVLILYKGRIVGELEGDEISEENLVHGVLGQGKGPKGGIDD